MISAIHHVTLDCIDPYGLASFWGQVTGYPVHSDDKPGDEEALLVADGGLPGILFVQVPEAKSVKNRMHFDLMPQDQSRDEEVQRLTLLGASVIDDRREHDGTGWVVMADPEGNEFCVERSAEERSSTPA